MSLRMKNFQEARRGLVLDFTRKDKKRADKFRLNIKVVAILERKAVLK